MDIFHIRLDTTEDIIKLNRIAMAHPDMNIFVQDTDGLKINAKSLLGLFATGDFNGLYLIVDKEIYAEIKDFVI